jgi:hypothetical protein
MALAKAIRSEPKGVESFLLQSFLFLFSLFPFLSSAFVMSSRLDLLQKALCSARQDCHEGFHSTGEFIFTIHKRTSRN